jgi:hypothetical protein
LAVVTLGSINATNTSTSTPPSFPSMPAGAQPLYIGYLQSTDSSINFAHLWAVGLGSAPTTGGASSFTQAPFLRGVTEQHHLGKLGSAPQIDGGVEWKPLSAVPNNGQRISNGGAATTANDFLTDANFYATPTIAGGGWPSVSTSGFTCTPTGTYSGDYEAGTVNVLGVMQIMTMYFNWTPTSNVNAGSLVTLNISLPASTNSAQLRAMFGTLAGGGQAAFSYNLSASLGGSATVYFTPAVTLTGGVAVTVQLLLIGG